MERLFLTKKCVPGGSGPSVWKTGRLRLTFQGARFRRMEWFPAPVLSVEPAYLHDHGRKCFNRIIETGVLHGVGLRNTLEPDPDNTGVGSFRSRTAFFLESQREFSCFMQCSGSPIALPRNHCPQVAFSLR